ncbi:UDP-N-acetylmuramate--alanine ligase [Planctomicrobium piriforme]|uniref:UDP-N-acetylmuramate--L-alanine ligase n=2 Tax=Planctomicrobium piriforme TaxID=1576369 RepID=A0A1I3G0Y7_9PLAN|nr:UDP-N-acetylmuramate--alanine ligase [Planctomicrobium piriforme]
MKALAEYLNDRGWVVTGSDGDPEVRTRQEFQRKGIAVFRGHAADQVPQKRSSSVTDSSGPGPDIVTSNDSSPPHPQPLSPEYRGEGSLKAVSHESIVLIYSPAVPVENVERQVARARGIAEFSYVEALAELTRHSTAVAVAGTHGKSTTSAMLGTLLSAIGRSPTLICGAELVDRGRSGFAGDGSLMVVEACEFRRHFLELSPKVACLLGIEPDHFDCYPDLDTAVDAYREFARRTPVDGTVVARSDCQATQRALEGFTGRVVTFSLDDLAADCQGIEITAEGTGSRFRIRHADQVSRWIQLRVPGRHNVLNAVAAAACAGVVGASLDEIAIGLKAFAGLRRRLEVMRNWRGSPVIDDYAHHPTEIRAAISAVRAMYPNRRLICVFQSHQASRTAALMDEFAAALSLADKVCILPIFAARETAGDCHEQVARELLSRLTAPAVWIATLDRVWGTLQTDAGTDAVILTLGAGNLTRVHHDSTD